MLEITKEQLADLLTQKYGKPTTVTDKMMAAYKEERTTEGKSINNSLTTLGNCVKQVWNFFHYLPAPAPRYDFIDVVSLLLRWPRCLRFRTSRSAPKK